MARWTAGSSASGFDSDLRLGGGDQEQTPPAARAAARWAAGLQPGSVPWPQQEPQGPALVCLPPRYQVHAWGLVDGTGYWVLGTGLEGLGFSIEGRAQGHGGGRCDLWVPLLAAPTEQSRGAVVLSWPSSGAHAEVVQMQMSLEVVVCARAVQAGAQWFRGPVPQTGDDDCCLPHTDEACWERCIHLPAQGPPDAQSGA